MTVKKAVVPPLQIVTFCLTSDQLGSAQVLLYCLQRWRGSVWRGQLTQNTLTVIECGACGGAPPRPTTTTPILTMHQLDFSFTAHSSCVMYSLTVVSSKIAHVTLLAAHNVSPPCHDYLYVLLGKTTVRTQKLHMQDRLHPRLLLPRWPTSDDYLKMFSAS